MDKIINVIFNLELKTLGVALLIFVFTVSLVTLGVHIPLAKLFSVLFPIASFGIIAGGLALLLFFILYFIKKDWFDSVKNFTKEYAWEIILLTLAFVVLISATFIPTV
ncbi:MAG: hypothetical protein OXT03_01620, partial [Alphaproteobacteria bacterium]|nr:hypothetical protein [Alphaproteobacteria bacterium]